MPSADLLPSKVFFKPSAFGIKCWGSKTTHHTKHFGDYLRTANPSIKKGGSCADASS
jgi:hypothetical protein